MTPSRIEQAIEQITQHGQTSTPNWEGWEEKLRQILSALVEDVCREKLLRPDHPYTPTRLTRRQRSWKPIHWTP